MNPSRRQFIKAAGGTLVAGQLPWATAEEPPPPPVNFGDLLAAEGFNPAAPDAALLAVVADLHIYLDSTSTSYSDRFDDTLVAELNALQPSLTHLVLAGDLITSHSVAMGQPRHPIPYERSRQEFRVALAQMARFRPDLQLIAIPGNHDSDNWETDAELWREELALPAYQKRVLGGVPVFFLNSGHAGALDAVQETWFSNEVAALDPDQEVLVVAHHPSFLGTVGEAGLKRTLVRVFANHRAPVWLIGGHGHSFYDQFYTHRGVRFLQMEVTSSNRKFWSDGRAAGYGLIGLQGGRVRARIFRSVYRQMQWVKPKLEQMTPEVVAWPFDRIQFPAALYEEGLYNRTGKLINFLANDLRTHFVYVQYITWQLDLARFLGKAREFLVLAGIGTSVLSSMTCAFSTTGLDGSWVSLPFPASDGTGVYRIPIPPEFLSQPVVFVKVATSIPRYGASLTIAGWGLASRAESLTGYERWLATHYRTILDSTATRWDAVPTGSDQANSILFAFNLPVPFVNPQNSGPGNGDPIIGEVIRGVPALSQRESNVVEFKFARRRESTNPGIYYGIEESSDLQTWSEVAADRLAIDVIDATWEEVRLSSETVDDQSLFHRVKVDPLPGVNGGYQQWPGHAMAPGGTGNDRDANGLDDLLDFAFDLEPGNSRRSYDRQRIGHPAGLPVHQTSRMPRPTLTFARMKAEAQPGFRYILEAAENLDSWRELPSGEYQETILRSSGEWDEVEIMLFFPVSGTRLFRVRLEPVQPLVSA